MRRYQIDALNGAASRQATSMSEAISKARRMLGVSRVFRGAIYQTDRPAAKGDREYCTAMDVWRKRSAATREMNTPADVVITW
jgi:hypothetical protein